MVIEQQLISKGTLWNTANELHHEFSNVDINEKIAIADAIYDGYYRL